LSLFVVLKGFVVFVVLLFATVTISKYVEKRIFKLKTLKPSFKVLVSKIIKIMFVTFVIIITIESIGLDITTLTVFSGALGLGLGFGLQKILSNIVSGLILLGDSSIKPGDVIAIGETYGW